MKNVINKSIKTFFILMILLTIYSVFNINSIYAAEKEDGNPLENPEYYDPSTETNEGDSEITEIGNKIIGPIKMIGSVVSVITIIIIGIRYMLGSIEEKAQYKETLGPYFIGAIMVFGITNLLSIVYEIASKI